jgi:hypothetical protein
MMSVSKGRTSRRRANQTTLFPEPANETGDNQESSHNEGQEPRTFSVYPQEGVSGFPLVEYITLEKPLSCVAVMSFACDVMIDGWI